MTECIRIVSVGSHGAIKIGERALELALCQKQVAAIYPGMRVFGVTSDGPIQICHREIIAAGFLVSQCASGKSEANIYGRGSGRIDDHRAGGDGDF